MEKQKSYGKNYRTVKIKNKSTKMIVFVFMTVMFFAVCIVCGAT